jgi:hypothetical protein
MLRERNAMTEESSPMWRRVTLPIAIGLLVAACRGDASSTSSPPPPSETAASPSAASPGELPQGGFIKLSAGNYSLADFPVQISFDIPTAEVPAGWFACSSSPVEQGICYEWSPEQFVAVVFQIVENVRTPPCSDQENAELLDPPVGPSVDDLVTAISDLEGYEATAPEDITVSGFEGKEFTLTVVHHAGCGASWSTADRVTGTGPGEINLLRVLDVDGERVMIAGVYSASTSEDVITTAEQVMDSVQIEP